MTHHREALNRNTPRQKCVNLAITKKNQHSFHGDFYGNSFHRKMRNLDHVGNKSKLRKRKKQHDSITNKYSLVLRDVTVQKPCGCDCDKISRDFVTSVVYTISHTHGTPTSAIYGNTTLSQLQVWHAQEGPPLGTSIL